MTHHMRLWRSLIVMGLALFLMLGGVLFYKQGQALDAARDAAANAEAAARTSTAISKQLKDCIKHTKSDCYQAAQQRDAFLLKATGAYVSCAAGHADVRRDVRRQAAVEDCFAAWTRRQTE